MSRISNISSKYRDLVSKSVLISSGCPVVYQLKPKKEKLETLTKLIVGEKNETKKNKTILLVGETGTGKSTLINALFNYTARVTWDDEVWFQIVEEKTSGDQTQSQTPDVIVYQIFDFEGQTLPYSLTIIDTPGYGDTRGIDRDVLVTEQLFDLFQSKGGVSEIHAVALVMKASENRLSDRLMYAFNSVTSLFGKDLERNIVTLVTHSDGVTPENVLQALETAEIKSAKNKKNQPLHFLFNNQQKKERKEDEDKDDDDDDKDEESPFKHAWKVTHKGMRQFHRFLEEVAPQSLEETVNVLKERIQLTACIQNLQERIELTELKQREITQIQTAVEEHEGEMRKNKRFTVRYDEVYKEKKNILGGWFFLAYEGATTCNVCEENCHYPGCTVAWSASKCKVMKAGRCTVCTRKCPAADHVKEKWKYVSKTRRVEKTDEEMKKKYEEKKAEKEKESNLLEDLKKEMEELTMKKYQLLEEAYQHVLSLEEIALNVNSLSTYVYYDLLIEKMKEKGDEEKVQKLERMKKQTEKTNKSGVGYVWGKMKAAGRWLQK